MFSIHIGTGGVRQYGYVSHAFSNVATILKFQMKQHHVISDAWTGSTFQSHTCLKAKHPVCIAIMGLLLGGHLPIKVQGRIQEFSKAGHQFNIKKIFFFFKNRSLEPRLKGMFDI